MKKRATFFFVLALCCSTILLTGCIGTRFKSIGSMATPSVHQPRQNMDKSTFEKGVSIDGFSLINGKGENIKDINGGGAIVNGIFYGKKPLSPFFLSASFGVFGGNTNFTCDDTEHCDPDYINWLKTDQGKDNYSFWATQEKVSLGAEFNIGFFLLGASGGIFAYQGGGDYDHRRNQLEVFKNISNDNSSDFHFSFSSWMGFKFGDKGKYGTLVLEFPVTELYSIDDTYYFPVSAAFFHPSGFHGGVMLSFDTDIELFVGKTFYF